MTVFVCPTTEILLMISYYHPPYYLKEVQALQREKDHFCKETEQLSTRLIEQEKAQEGSIIAQTSLLHR